MLLRVCNRSIIEQTQQFIIWNQNTSTEFLLLFSEDEIMVQVNGEKKNKVSIQRFIRQPFFLVVGDCDHTLGTSVKSLESICISDEHSVKKKDMPLDLNIKSYEWRGLRKKVFPSFI